MTTIGLVANDELLAVTLNPKLTSGDQNTVEIQVDFSEDWDRFSKSAVFFTSNDRNNIYEKVMINSKCIVPAEVMVERGVLYIGVRGVNSEKNEVKTTSLVKLKILEGTPAGTGTEVEPTADVYQQLLTAYGKTDNAISKEKSERQAEIAVERARIDNILTLGGLPASEYELKISSEMPNGTTATLVTNGYTANIEISNFSIPARDDDAGIIFRVCDIPLEFKPLYANPYGLYREKHTSYDAVDFTYDEFRNTGRLMCEFKTNLPVNIEKIVISYPLKNPMTPAELQDIRTGYDGRIYTSAGEAVREQVGELYKYYDRSPNLFNPETVSVGAIIKTSGVLSTGFTGWRSSDYIPIKKGVTYYFSNDGVAYQLSTCALYDGNKNFIVGYGNDIEGAFNKGYSITAEQDCYLRVSLGKVFPDKFQIEANEITEYKSHDYAKIKDKYIPDFDISNIPEKSITGALIADKTITPENTDFFRVSTNLFNPETVSVGAQNGNYFDATNFPKWRTTDYIPVKANVTYYCSEDGIATKYNLCSLFDTNKTFVSKFANDQKSFTPSVDGYVRLSLGKVFPDKFQIEANEITEYKEYGVVETKLRPEYMSTSQNAPEKWSNKKVLIMGDSITSFTGNLGWTTYFKDYIKAEKVINLAVSGATWKDKEANQTYDGNPVSSTTGNVIGNQLQKAINAKENGDADYADFDVVIIAAGTNDSYDSTKETNENVEKQFVSAYGAGKYTVIPINEVDRQTFAGIMRYTYQKLQETYPNAKMVICSPIQECYESYTSIYNKGEHFRYIASRLSVEFWNTRDCGICNLYESPTDTIDYDNPSGEESTVKRDLTDGIHPSESGAKKIAVYNASSFKKLYI